MNTEEIDRALRQTCAKDFDGVFSADTLPEKPRLLVANTDPLADPGVIGCACSWKADAENTLIRSDDRPLQISKVI